jgi:hypothetical protein
LNLVRTHRSTQPPFSFHSPFKTAPCHRTLDSVQQVESRNFNRVVIVSSSFFNLCRGVC